MRGVTSSMLRILEEDTELVANATRTTYRQLDWAHRVLGFLKRYKEDDVVTEGLVPKLEQLRDLTREKI